MKQRYLGGRMEKEDDGKYREKKKTPLIQGHYLLDLTVVHTSFRWAHSLLLE